jgi:hypothetical protein
MIPEKLFEFDRLGEYEQCTVFLYYGSDGS